MTGNEYQELAMRTNDGQSTYKLEKAVDYWDGSFDIGGVVMGCMGLSGETGEVVDMIKKSFFHNAPMDLEHLKRELGDVLWYVACICESFGLEMDDVMQTNIQKLKDRYPDGFDEFLSAHRKVGDV